MDSHLLPGPVVRLKPRHSRKSRHPRKGTHSREGGGGVDKVLNTTQLHFVCVVVCKFKSTQ